MSNSNMESNECCICYETIGKTNNCITPCSHQFCLKCLATAMRRNSCCPICRTSIIDEEEDDVDEDDDEDEDDDDEEDDDSFIIDDEGDNVGTVEEIAKRMEEKGISYLDVVCMMMHRYSSRFSESHIEKINDIVDTIISDADSEQSETHMFAMEDHRSHELEVKKENVENSLFGLEDTRSIVLLV